MDSCVSIRLDLPFPASFCWRFLLNVAEKTSVCLGKSSGSSSSSSTSTLSMAFKISSASLKCPSVRRRSASSTTRKLTVLKESNKALLELRTSHRRPGVPITMSAFSSCRCCLCTDKPPVTEQMYGGVVSPSHSALM